MVWMRAINAQTYCKISVVCSLMKKFVKLYYAVEKNSQNFIYVYLRTMAMHMW